LRRSHKVSALLCDVAWDSLFGTYGMRGYLTLEVMIRDIQWVCGHVDRAAVDAKLSVAVMTRGYAFVVNLEGDAIWELRPLRRSCEKSSMAGMVCMASYSIWRDRARKALFSCMLI
jgi:hypothetical protein